MSVEWVREKHESRRSSYRDGQLTHTRVFQVKTTDPHDGTAVALTADDGVNRVPRAGETYRSTKVSSIEADADPKSFVHFTVTVESTSGNGSNSTRELHPLDRPPEVNFGSNECTEPYFVDESDDTEDGPYQVVNSAGDAFESFRERERGYSVITVVRNEMFHDPIQAEEFGNTINIDYFTIDGTTYPPGTLKLSPVTATRVVEMWQSQEIIYYKRSYVFKFKREGWDDALLDVGLNELVGDEINGWKLLPIVDAAGLIVKKPYPLDGAGRRRLNPFDLPAELVFRPYRHRPWSEFGLV